ncbi:MAG: tetratricopeptide repeat protein [Candidatus Omnitrophota bacterium]
MIKRLSGILLLSPLFLYAVSPVAIHQNGLIAVIAGIVYYVCLLRIKKGEDALADLSEKSGVGIIYFIVFYLSQGVSFLNGWMRLIVTASLTLLCFVFLNSIKSYKQIRVTAAVLLVVTVLISAGGIYMRKYAQEQYEHALALEKENKIDDAITQYKATLKYDPNHKKAQHDLASLLAERKLVDELREVLDKYWYLDLNNIDLRLELAQALFSEQKLDDAFIQYRKVAICNGDILLARSMLGLLYMKKGKFREALYEYLYIFKKDPEYDGIKGNIKSLSDAWGWIDNGDFHYWTDNGLPQKWTKDKGVFVSMKRIGESNECVEMKTTIHYGNLSQTIEVLPSTEYIFSVFNMVKPKSAASFDIYGHESGGLFKSETLLNSKWTKQKAEFTTGKLDNQITIYLQGVKPGDVVYWNNVRLDIGGKVCGKEISKT